MDVEQRARDALNEAHASRYTNCGEYYTQVCSRKDNFPLEAVCRLIEQQDAFAREVSDAVKAYGGRDFAGSLFDAAFSRFILPEPVETEDPVDALVELLAPVLTHGQGMAAREREDRFRNALRALTTPATVDGEGAK